MKESISDESICKDCENYRRYYIKSNHGMRKLPYGFCVSKRRVTKREIVEECDLFKKGIDNQSKIRENLKEYLYETIKKLENYIESL